MNTGDKQKRLLEGNVYRLIISLAIPTMLTMIITSVYNMADAYFVGRISVSASGAVSVVYSYMAIVQAFGYFFGHGSGNYVSRKLGAGEREKAETMATVGFFSAFVFGAAAMAAGLTFLKPLAYFLGSTDTILPYAEDYLKYILIGTPFMAASLVLNNQLRFQGSAIYAMTGIFTGGLLNIGLDFLFIIRIGLGTSGAGLATAISQFVSFCILLIGTLFGGNIRIKLNRLKPTAHLYKEILRCGLPSFARQSTSSLSVIFINYACAAAAPLAADEMIAAFGITAKITGLLYALILGFGQGFQPVCGFNFGAKKYDRVIKGFAFSAAFASVLGLFLGILGIIFAKWAVSAFTRSENVIGYAAYALKLQCAAFGFIGYLTVSNMALQNVGSVVPATVLSLARQGLCFIPAIAALCFLFGSDGIFFAQPLADIAAFFLSVPLSVSLVKKLKKL